jgi:hypothetical protein
MIFDTADAPETQASLKAAKADAQLLVKLWDSRARYATVAFVLSCAAVYPFLAGHVLHGYWNSFGKYLVLLSMALLVPFVACVGVAINTRLYRRNLSKIEL